MAVMDEFKDERKSLKGQPLKKRLAHFWYYYKIHTLGGIIAIILLITLISDMMNSKDYALYGIIVNAFSLTQDFAEETDPFTEDYAAYANIDMDKYRISFDTSFRLGSSMDEMSVNTSQMIMVYTAAKDLDVMGMDAENFTKYAYNGAYADLREVFSPEELEAYKDTLFYMDLTVAQEISEIQEGGDVDFIPVYPDYSRPEEMADPVPVGFRLDNCEKFQEHYTFGSVPGYIGIIVNTPRLENARAFISYLFDF